MVNIPEQIAMFISCMAVGIAVGFLYDLCAALRLELRLKKAVPIIDVIFWIVTVYLCFIALYKSGMGQMRGFVPIGVAVGFGLYALSCGKLISRWMVISVRTLSWAVRTVCGFISAPFVKIYCFFRGFLRKNKEIVQNLQKKCRIFVRKTLEKKSKNSII